MKLIIYRVFGFLLMPVALLFSICVLILISAAFANPAILLPLFLIVCIVIYSFVSLNFLIKGIDGQKPLKKSSKDLLKVNAFVSIVFALLMISQCIVLILHPEMVTDLLKQAKQNAVTGVQVSDAAILNYLHITSYFFLVYAIVLAVHILFSFQYLKQYNYLFKNDNRQA